MVTCLSGKNSYPNMSKITTINHWTENKITEKICRIFYFLYFCTCCRVYRSGYRIVCHISFHFGKFRMPTKVRLVYHHGRIPWNFSGKINSNFQTYTETILTLAKIFSRAPIVDAFFSKRIGRRKSWLVPMQYLIGFCMLFFSNFVHNVLEDKKINIHDSKYYY